jgi:hypothetical protein
MKRFYMILAALLIGSVCFAQRQTIKLDNPIPASNERSAWVGNTGASTLDIIASGEEYAIAPKQAQNIAAGSTITKVKFYSDATNYVTYGATNTSFTIKIYENINLAGTLAGYGLYDLTSVGTAVYTQNVTATDGWNEVTLTTPYTVTNNEFWVAIHANGTSCIFFGGADDESEGIYYKYYTVSDAQEAAQLGCNAGDSFWTIPEYCVDQACSDTEIDPIALAVFVEDGTEYVPTSDFEVKWFGGISNNNLTAAQASYTLSTTESLTLLPFFANNGADDAVAGTVTFNVTAGGQALVDPVTVTLDGTEEGTIPVGGWYNLIDAPYSLTLTAEDMDAMNLTNFEICLTVTYSGNDPNTNNNSHCISVTRGGETPQTSSDLEAMLFLDAQGATEVGATMTLAGDDDFLVFPAIKNNGPDAASSGTVTINVTMDGSPLIQPQSLALSSQMSIPSGQVVGITQSGLSLTAAQMDQYGITGTFEICYTITYSGTDPNTANNSKCVTVTRQSVAVKKTLQKKFLYILTQQTICSPLLTQKVLPS